MITKRTSRDYAEALGVAPAQVGVQGAGLDGVVGVVGVREGELAQGSEVGLD